ncbi:MAG: ribosome maturation factor RimM [Actinomycetota bacterium]|nr:ribosome maturation factor RimM [Actinomycetota bacterium]
MSSSTSSTDASRDWLLAGRVGRPHGLDGSFHVQDGRFELLAEGMSVCLHGRPRTIVRRAGTPARPILRLEGCRGREDAERLRAAELLVRRDAAPDLGENEFYAEELQGCLVHDGEQRIGVVRALRALPSCEVLEVEREEGGELLVPLVRDAVRAVDTEARRIDVDLAFLGER